MSTPQTSGRPSRRQVARDVGTFIGGWALLFQQALFVDPAKVNELFLVVALVLIGVPGAAELLPRFFPGLGATASPRSQPPPADSPPPPSSPPATSPAGGDPP